ncbi:MAG: hypothetical protein AAF297_10575 [Planctomycetota bacterium]
MIRASSNSGIHGTQGPFRIAGRLFVFALATAITAGPFAATALAQDALTNLNSRYDELVPSRRAERVLIPALADLEPAPIGVDRLPAARLLPTDAVGWSSAERWAMAESQRRALEALDEITEERRYERAMVFAQPYGVAGLAPDVIRTRLYTDLGDPPLLAAAQHRYLPKMDELRKLVHVEATRLVADGRAADAADLLLRLAALGRQMVDRAMMAEVVWGYEAMVDALSRVRDVMYLDFLGDRTVSPSELADIVDRLDADGFLAVERLSYPLGNEAAARQLIARVYEERGGVREDVFLSTMVRLSGGDRPLRRFAGAARWSGTASNQVDWFRVNEVVDEVYSGWSGRWFLDPFDPVMQLPFAVDTADDLDRAVVVALPAEFETESGESLNGSELFELRQVLEVERVATRLSLGVLGRYYVTGLYPPAVSSIRPRWVRRIEADAYNPNRDAGAQPPMEFFVPVRDAYVADERDEPEPHRMQVFPGDGTNFAVTLFEDQFVLYSVGPNGARDWAERVSQDRDALLGDYLVWPPVLGLHRVHLRALGEFE